MPSKGKKVKSIGEVVREVRGDKSQREFGKLIGDVPASVICEIELDKISPSKTVAIKLTNFSGLPLDTFIR